MKTKFKTTDAYGLQGKEGGGRCAQKRKKKYRRSDTKVMTQEAKVLKFLRESRRLSMRRAGKILGTSDTFVSHCEHGRIDLNPSIITKFLHAYGYDYHHFQKIVLGHIVMPQSLFDECLILLKGMSEDKLKTVKTVLQSF